MSQQHDDDAQERSPSGSPIWRHEAPEAAGTPEFSVGDAVLMEGVCTHMERHFGPITEVMHEILSPLVHVDVHVIAPHGERDHYTLFTTGMGEKPMGVPAGREDLAYAELMVHLPADWPLDREEFRTSPPGPGHERWYWPVRWLKELARLPHEYQTWLGIGHTVPNGDPPQPFAEGTPLCSVMLLPPLGLPDGAEAVSLPDGRKVNLYVLHPLHLAELNLKLTKGMDALLDAFDAKGVSPVVDPQRASSVRRKLFGLF